MSENLNKLKAILREMFQLDQADLDFGIYRIMNQKREEIEQFLDRDLLPQVKTAFAQFKGEDLQAVRDELDKLKKTLDDAGVVAETSPKFQILQAKLSQSVDVASLENDVFSQLTNFFRRYYHEGDFLSLRRYKAGVYAIPYEGEEVKLHWANADQYYIKSSENFRDYTFKLPSGKRAHFKLVDASTEQNNKKEQAGKERRFMLCADSPVIEDAGELFIRFEYKVDEAGAKQAGLNEAAVQTVLNLLPRPQGEGRGEGGADWKRELSTLAPTEKNPRRTLLEKHLNDYTAKYSFDYFIHKDLGGFLRRELDFFIKNEVLFIDDLDVDHVRASISKVKVIKEIGHKVIAFLEQLENFQKKLWLKKKFVVETGYCCTLDKVPEELYPSIIANTAQVDEWKRLFAIQDIQGDLHTPAYSDPLTMEFLKANPFLVLDTAFYDQEFTEKLLASFDNLNEATDGLLVHSENFQALNLMLERYRGQVNCVYIDPPYNTGTDGFHYKDNYQHSSWSSMMYDRIQLGKALQSNLSTIFSSIDDGEQALLRQLMAEVYGDANFVNNIIWQKKYAPSNDAKWLSDNHDFITVFAKDKSCWRPGLLERSEKTASMYQNPDDDPRGAWKSGDLSVKTYSANSDYPITTPSGRVVTPPDGRCWVVSNEKFEQMVNDNRIWFGKDGNNVPSVKRFLSEVKDGVTPLTLWTYEEVGHNQEAKKELVSLFNLENGPSSEELSVTTPKPVRLLSRIVKVSNSNNNAIVLDYFAGSGTTAHAVINQNREDNGNRKYILVEQGDYFDTVLKPRIQKVIYSKDWNNGKPVSRQGSSHLFKYIRLESYEDALNNLRLNRTPEQGSLLEQHDTLREQYMLSYMLDVESAGSTSLLNIDAFTNPFNYRMNIARGNETKETVVDLVETFNWLLGIKVLRISQKEHRTAEFETDSEGRLQIKGRSLKANPPQPPFIKGGVTSSLNNDGALKSPFEKGDLEGFQPCWTFQEVEGQTLSGDKVLVIWRTCTTNPEQDNVMLDEWFGKRNYSTLDFEFGRIYVNGDNNLENLKVGEERWKVALIEEEFKRLMFDVEGV